jgi:glycosyltransferase involved in cell wall biosynthesis
VISLANYSAAKNQERIVEAVRRCRRDFDITYLHCGADADALVKATGLSADDPVRLLGPVSNIGDFLAAADAFVSPSINEGGPISLLEAGSVGIVCITTEVGLAELFRGVPNVRMIEPTAESLEQAIRETHELALTRRLADGKQLADFTNSNFGPSVGVNKYLETYTNQKPQ